MGRKEFINVFILCVHPHQMILATILICLCQNVAKLKEKHYTQGQLGF